MKSLDKLLFKRALKNAAASRDKTFGLSRDGRALAKWQERAALQALDGWNAANREPGQHVGPVTRTIRAVAVATLSFTNAGDGACFPSYEAIAARADCGRTTVWLALCVLEAAGFLAWVHRIRRAAGRVLRTSNSYSFPFAPRANFRTRTQPLMNPEQEQPAPQPVSSALEAALASFAQAMGVVVRVS